MAEELITNSADNESPPAAVVGEGQADRPCRSRKFAIVGIGAFLAVVLLAALVSSLAGSRIPPLSDNAIQDAERLWQTAGPASYDMQVEIRGAQPGLVQVTVRNNVVTAMARDGRSPPDRTWNVWTVPGMFETLEREAVLAEDPVHEMSAAAGTQVHVRCEFDRRYGYPRRYHRFVTSGGPEVYWLVSLFEPR